MAITTNKINYWRSLGDVEGFFQWVDDVQPRIKHEDNKYRPIVLADWQKERLRPILEKDSDGRCINKICCITWPRRHGKSYMNALIALYRFTVYDSQIIKVLANSSAQAVGTSFRLVKDIIAYTPDLIDLIGKRNLQGAIIRNPKMGSEIEAVPNNPSVLYGQKVNLAIATELHRNQNEAALGVLSESITDSVDGQVLTDSTTDGPGGPIDNYEKLQAEGTPGIYVTRIEYKDIEELLRKAPSWVDRAAMKILAKTRPPYEFGTQYLNRRSDAANSLFRSADIDAAMADYRCPVGSKDIEALVAGRKCVVGGGLDRAKSFSKHVDSTIHTAVGKALGNDDEPHYWVFNQERFPLSDAKAIKRSIVRDNDRYGLQNYVLESYETTDLLAWCADAKIPAEGVHAGPNEQRQAFSMLHRIVSEGRLHFSRDLIELEAELRLFTYDATGRYVSFGAPEGDAFHDDRVYSLAWAVWSLRQEELTAYELSRVVCQSKRQHAQYCYLRNGGLILPCSQECEAHKRVEAMHIQYSRKAGATEMTLPEFYKNKVRLKGAKIYQGV